MNNRIAIITGASSGVGKATALELSRKGVKVVLNARNTDKLEALCKEINEFAAGSAIWVSGDVSDKWVMDQCCEKCLYTWNVLPDIFIASAGRGLPGTVMNSDENEWNDIINTNFNGLMRQLKCAGEIMTAHIAAERNPITHPLDIIVLGSNIGRNVSPFNSVYGATKFAARGLTTALQRELGPKGIRVTLIEPGMIATSFQETAGYDPEWFGRYASEIGPVLQAADIAGIISFLVGLPGNVNLDIISIRPTRQAYP
ncbi:NADP-dependent 3-hydroxy acid dehydrogenase YdfG [Chitinophaga sp. W3I9]|uniref:SDR family NAD(P)-dependent oxidoreductase n=1 Tax=unclassified Chitinophaga TaxID=2619133 RepID=UPI003D1E81E6